MCPPFFFQGFYPPNPTGRPSHRCCVLCCIFIRVEQLCRLFYFSPFDLIPFISTTRGRGKRVLGQRPRIQPIHPFHRILYINRPNPYTTPDNSVSAIAKCIILITTYYHLLLLIYIVHYYLIAKD